MQDGSQPRIRRLLAPNPSPMTGPGTNGYIVGEGTVAVVDPGPDDDRHLVAWLDALDGEEVSHILVTHAHLDHSGLARRLSAALGAPVCGFGRWDAGRSATMQRLAALPRTVNGGGVDRSFDPDVCVQDGQIVTGPGWRVSVLHTPGHFAGHLAFVVGDVALTGDHVLGWTSTIIAPPDGDLRQFLASCERLSRLTARAFLPGHGEAINDPLGRLDWLVGHRRDRERQVLEALAQGATTVEDVVGRLYTATPASLRPAAAQNVFAHLVSLTESGRVTASPELSIGALYTLA